MHITPLDIRKHPFRKTFKGFDPDQVNSFLNLIADEYENLIRTNNELATQLKSAEQKLEQYTKIEKTLNETLLTAQRATDEARVNAQKEAELILKDAQIRAGRYEDDARRRVEAVESDLVALRNQRDSFLARFKSMLRTQLDLLTTISEDLAEDGGPGERDDTLAEVPTESDESTDRSVGSAGGGNR
ncbi:MAG: DivIVA domain-containing protein [Chitinivibrionales bacterium]|nr:DivIVA domain-containing protein [Chitinivibrionales bacterium]